MIVVTYKQWHNGGKYIDGYYEEYTSVYENKSDLKIELEHWEDLGNPMIILGLWEI